MITLINDPRDASLKNIKINYGKLVFGSPWERFGKYNYYLVIDEEKNTSLIKGHAGELVPGSTEDLIEFYNKMNWQTGIPSAPMTLELDSTYSCLSKDCGGHCFSYSYRKTNPEAQISADNMKFIISHFAKEGGRIVRFDGGGEPLLSTGVANGLLVNHAYSLGLKTTILTSGDIFGTDNVNKDLLIDSECYIRFSLNAATQKTRKRIHGNNISLIEIFNAIKSFSNKLMIKNKNTPIGATFLLSHINFQEIFECAKICKDIGVKHFSVRRVLGPEEIRPDFNENERRVIKEQFNLIKNLENEEYQIFLPWRDLNEPDLPAKLFDVDRCWQSTVKTVIEPDPSFPGKAKIQMCGRCRGNTISNKLPPISKEIENGNWLLSWRNTFKSYPFSREELLQQCNSCIDYGFIKLFDELAKYKNQNISLVHVKHN